ncbi:MAG: hypothetical protein HPY75_15165 [Actinobacteria bacterium]|nr:hypothetical protein [Actinomycetota bacterium]
MADAYKSLWQVERAFRELKSGLDLSPIYHWLIFDSSRNWVNEIPAWGASLARKQGA